MKSTVWKAVAIASVCLLIAGCAPSTGIKGIAALVAMVVSIVAAAVGFSCNKDEERVVQKGQELEQQVAKHVDKYH